ncbi:CysB family HTH-type transcriptional regulator [soil metagenome]
MKLRQLECFLEVVRCDLNMSLAASALQATQPAISKQIRLLERELEVSLFNERGNKLLSLTTAGLEILDATRGLMKQADKVRRIAADYATRRGIVFNVASSHIHAKYTLVQPVKEFMAAHAQIDVRLLQLSTEQVFARLLDGTADLGFTTQPPEFHSALGAIPCYQMTHSVVMPVDHPLEKKRTLTLEMISRFPMIAHDIAHQIGGEMLRRFNEAGLRPNFVLQAQDSDVMKAYVEAGVGIAIIPKMAFSPLRDKKLRSKDVSHLFAPTTTYVFFRRDAPLPAHAIDFISLLAPSMSREELVKRASAAPPGTA